MLNNRIKSANVKAGRPELQSAREATAGRGLQASRGFPADVRASLQALAPSKPADRLGTAFTLLLGLALAGRRLADGRADLGEPGYDSINGCAPSGWLAVAMGTLPLLNSGRRTS